MCEGCQWRDQYIGELVSTIENVKRVMAEVPEAWSQLEHAGVGFTIPERFDATTGHS